jgi:hypothetical protein
MIRSRLRFAVLCDSAELERWQISALRELIADGDSEPVATVVTTRRVKEAEGGVFRRLLQPEGREPAESIDAFFQSIGVSVSTFKIESGGAGASRSTPSAFESLTALDLDFILYLGFGTCDAYLARSAKYGLWRFRFGDASKYENYPPGVWEIIAGDPLTAATLCRQHADAGGMTDLRSGVFATISHKANANAEQVLAEVTHWPAYVARNVRQGHHTGDGETIDAKPVAEPAFPNLGARMRLAWNHFVKKIARLPNLFFEDKWNVGIVEAPIQRFLERDLSWTAAWFPNRDRHCYFADPMGATVGGSRVVLCEKYDYRTRLGSLCSLGVDDRGWVSTVSPAIPTGVHASYPYLFKVGEELYCVPETSQAREAVLYQMMRFPGDFRPVRPLLSHFACADPTIFEHGGHWWLFCTDATDGEHTKLLVYYAKGPLETFVPHPLNPVKIDVRSARPAGTPFESDGKLYRPSQDCSRTYGGAVTINEVTLLTPTSFHELAITTVKPGKKSGYAFGLHTLSRFGDMTLIDSKRLVFTGRGLREKWGSMLSRFSRTEPGRARLSHH